MTSFLSKYKGALILLIIALIGFGVYVVFFKNEDMVIIPVEPTSGAEMFEVLAKIQNIRLDTSVLNDPTFSRLHDFGLVITRDASGRVNPFAPIPGGTRGPQVTPISSLSSPVLE